jgi:PGM1 C-terminal domain
MDHAELAEKLGRALEANKPGGKQPHVLVVLPSFSVSETLLSHYGPRIPALEHRYMLAYLLLHRIGSCEMIYLSTESPGEAVLEYLTALLPAKDRPNVKSRFQHIPVPDHTPRSVAAKILDRPDLIARLKAVIGGRPAFIEPWNVTRFETDLAAQLGIPINGTSPKLWPLGFKSAGRRMFVDAGVPVPYGREGVQTVADVLRAIDEIRTARPQAQGVVIKHDESGAGDGNAVIKFADLDRQPDPKQALRERLEGLPAWYLKDLLAGGIVEELVAGERFSSPSAQMDILPDGTVNVLATHEQILGGDTGQVFIGCRFPADPAYAKRLAAYGRDVGKKLAAKGALGRFSLDFATTLDADGNWQVFALEVNLRKGGTTHPYAALRSLVPGHYDAELGRWVASDGSARAYCSTDNLVHETWLGMAPQQIIDRIADAGLQFDYGSGTGIVLHMLSCLAIDGRFGLTAIGTTPEHAAELYDAAQAAVLPRP